MGGRDAGMTFCAGTWWREGGREGGRVEERRRSVGVDVILLWLQGEGREGGKEGGREGWRGTGEETIDKQ